MPFLLGLAFAAIGLGLSTLGVQETRGHARLEATCHLPRPDGRHDHLGPDLSGRDVFVQTSFREPALSSASQTGLVNNLNDGLAWGPFPIPFAAVYPAVWGAGQLLTGTLSDRWGRKRLIASGMCVQALGLALVVAGDSFTVWAVASVLLGAHTAMVYPTLLAAIGDVAHPAWRARSVGVYRLWRDAGVALGALVSGVVADVLGVRTVVSAGAALTAFSGVVVAWRM